jgi:glycosyltransferase involved in cell wall biosynthesis
VKNVLWHQTELPAGPLARAGRAARAELPAAALAQALCPLVATIHDLAPFHVTGKYDWKRMIYGRVIVKRLAARQDEIIAVSENTARDLKTYFRPRRDRVNVIWNGIDHQRFQPGDAIAAKAEAARRWQLDRPFFLYVSRLEHPGKNHVRLIEAFNRFKTERVPTGCWRFGGSDWHGAEAIHAAAKSSPFAADIRFLGFVDDPACPDCTTPRTFSFIRRCSRVLVSRPLRRWLAACPVISSTRGSLREVVADAALTIEPENIGDIAGALAKMSGNAGEREHWRARGFANARRFDWNENAAQTLAIYERAIRRGK